MRLGMHRVMGRRGERSRGGVALILVLLVIATATVFGLGYLSSSTVKIAAAQNTLNASRAKYVAESGLQHAMYVLETNPELLVGSAETPLGPYTIGGDGGSYYFYAIEDQEVVGKFYLTAIGQAGAISRTCSFSVICNRGEKVEISHSLLIDGSGASLPSGLTVTGDIHNNGNFLLNYATVHGQVSAFGSVFDPFRRIDGVVTTGVEKLDMPDIRPDYYKVYAVNGVPCIATEKTVSVLDGNDLLTGGGAISPENVGGVVWLKPEMNNLVQIADDVEFHGTILVEGDLALIGKGITITAQPGFPALVVTGRILIGPGATATIDGVVVCGGGISPTDGQAAGSQTTINGGLICGWAGYDSSLQGVHQLNYEENRGKLYDFRYGSAEDEARVTISILDFQ